MPRKPTILAKDEISSNSNPEVNSIVIDESLSDDEVATLQAEKPQVKQKRPQTEAQKLATAKMRQKLAEKHQRIRDEKAKQEEEKKRHVEEKIVQKALSIKKKQIKKEQVLDEISDDDTPIEEVIPVYKARRTAINPVPKPIAQRQSVPKEKPLPVRESINQGYKILFV
jgi:chromosome segregation ATPase